MLMHALSYVSVGTAIHIIDYVTGIGNTDFSRYNHVVNRTQTSSGNVPRQPVRVISRYTRHDCLLPWLLVLALQQAIVTA